MFAKVKKGTEKTIKFLGRNKWKIAGAAAVLATAAVASGKFKIQTWTSGQILEHAPVSFAFKNQSNVSVDNGDVKGGGNSIVFLTNFDANCLEVVVDAQKEYSLDAGTQTIKFLRPGKVRIHLQSKGASEPPNCTQGLNFDVDIDVYTSDPLLCTGIKVLPAAGIAIFNKFDRGDNTIEDDDILVARLNDEVPWFQSRLSWITKKRYLKGGIVFPFNGNEEENLSTKEYSFTYLTYFHSKIPQNLPFYTNYSRRLFLHNILTHLVSYEDHTSQTLRPFEKPFTLQVKNESYLFDKPLSIKYRVTIVERNNYEKSFIEILQPEGSDQEAFEFLTKHTHLSTSKTFATKMATLHEESEYKYVFEIPHFVIPGRKITKVVRFDKDYNDKGFTDENGINIIFADDNQDLSKVMVAPKSTSNASFSKKKDSQGSKHRTVLSKKSERSIMNLSPFSLLRSANPK